MLNAALCKPNDADGYHKYQEQCHMDKTTALNFHNCYTIKKDKDSNLVRQPFWVAVADRPPI